MTTINNNTGRTEADAAIEAGSKITTLTGRVAEMSYLGTPIPLMINAHGGVQLLKEAVELHERLHPPRAGAFTAGNVSALADWILRYRTKDTLVYVSASGVRAVIDDTPAFEAAPGAPPTDASLRGARKAMVGQLHLRQHVRLQAWLGASNKPLSVDELAELVEANVDDLATADLVTFVRNMELAEATSWKRSVDAQGRVKLTAESAQSGTPVPRAFVIRVPYFEFDAEPTALKFRLVLTMSKGQVSFKISCADIEEVRSIRLSTLAAEISSALDGATPVLLGEPK
jgi:hypothetical protein